MKKLNLKFGSTKEMLTKEQMRNVTGGYSGGCGPDNYTDTWTCCNGSDSYFIGERDCESAADDCNLNGGGKITNDPSRC